MHSLYLLKKLRKKFTRQFLYTQYHKKKKSINEIAKENNASARFIIDRFKKYKIKIKSVVEGVSDYWDLRKNRRYISKKWLILQYLKKKKSTLQLAVICKASGGTIRKWLKTYKIPRRPIGGIFNINKN